MVDAYGSVTWWGFSPALDLQEKDLLHSLKKLKCSEEDSNHRVDRNKEPLKILLVGAADLRHVLKTCALRRRNRYQNLNFYIIENNLEVIARQMLMISVIFESKETLGLKEKVELFLELFGNSLIRPKTDEVLRQKCTELIRLVTNPEYLEKTLSMMDLSGLKFKERDALEAIFKFWKNVEQKYFDIPSLWDQRMRQYLSVRYDSRQNVYDWDYNMKLRDKAPMISFNEYKSWRENGVAFELREDSSYEVPNRTLASGLLIKKDGERFARRGYWGDIINSPYLSYGIESEEKSLFKKNNDAYLKTATNVAEHNITAWIYELMTGDAYSTCPLRAPGMTKKLSPRSGLSEITEESGDSGKEELKEVDEEKRKLEESKTSSYHTEDDIRIHFLPLGCFPDLPRKSKYKGFFDVIFFSNSMVHLLKEDVKSIVSGDAKLVIETCNFMLDLRNEHRVEYNKKTKAMAEAFGFKMVGKCDAEKDSFAFFDRSAT